MEDLFKTLQLAQDLGILINQEKSQLISSQLIVRQESAVVHPKDPSFSESTVLLCQLLDESTWNPLLHRDVCIIGETM